jgi:heterodisulfide reductase subunit C
MISNQAHVDPALGEALAEVRRMVATCMQCGTCSASCPNVAAMDMTPRRMWRLAQLGLLDELARSQAFWLCSACYTCTMRCPRGLPVTEVLYALKRVAAALDLDGARRRSAFYRAFMDNARHWGRVQEGPLMRRYLLGMRSPGLALSFAPLGLKLAARGKLHLTKGTHKGVLEPLCRAVEDIERGEVRP